MTTKKKSKRIKKSAAPLVYSRNLVQTKARGAIRRTAATLSTGASGGGGGTSSQSMAQSPLYYDYRWSTPDKFYYPRNRVVANSIWREVYKRDPAVAIATDMYAELPWSGFDLMGIEDKHVLRVYEDMFSSLNIVPKLASFTRDYYITGELILHNIFNSTKGIWERIIPHNPDYVKVEGVALAIDQPLLSLLPTPEIRKLINSPDPRVRKLQALIPKDIINAFRANRDVPLDPLNTTYMARHNSSYDVRGSSLYTRLYRVIMYEDFIVNASLAVAQRNAVPLRIFKLGDPNTGWLPDQEDEASFAEMLSTAESDPLAAIIMHHNVTCELVGVTDRVLLISKEWDYIERVKLLALGVSKAFLVGETSFACFEKGTPVIRSDGTPIPIEDVRVGDTVLDQYGKSSKVINNWCEGVPDNLLEVEVWGGRRFRVTPNHRFPAWMWPTDCACGCNSKIKSVGRSFAVQKHAAKCSHTHLSSKCTASVHAGRHRISELPVGYDPNRIVEAHELRKGDFLKVPLTRDKETKSEITEDIARLVGYYLAEGSISYGSTNGVRTKPCELRLSFGAHEENTWIKDVKSICKNLGIRCEVARWKGKPSCLTVRIIPEDKKFLDLFIKHADVGSYTKVLSAELMLWPIELIKEVIRGYFRGDGCRNDTPTPAQRKRNARTLATVQVGTISEKLATQLMLVLARLGIPAGHAVAYPKPSRYSRKPYHILRVQGTAAIELCKFVWDEDLNAKAHRCSVWKDEEFMYLPIRSIKTVNNTEPVYNLEVEGSHTYLVCDGVATCNSAVAGLQTLMERLQNLRMQFENDWIMKKLCEPVAEIQQFYKRTEAELNNRIRVKKPLDEYELIVPKIKWHKSLESTQDVAILNIWRDLKERGIISERTYSQGAGVDIDTERKQIAEEKKYKEEHPEIYGIPQPQAAPGAPGGMPGGKPGAPKAPPGVGAPMPPGAPPAPPMASAKYGSSNPYYSAHRQRAINELEDRLDGMADSENKVDVRDVLETVEAVEEEMGMSTNSNEMIPSVSSKFLTED